MFVGVFGRWPLIAFALLNGTRIGRAISLGLLALVVVEMINGPGPDLRAEAMRNGSFDCVAALNEPIEDDSWNFCSGKFGETRWVAMFNANLDQKWDALAKTEADDKAAYAAKEAELTAQGRRAAQGR